MNPKNVLILEDDVGALLALNECVKVSGHRGLPFIRIDSHCLRTMMQEPVHLIILDLGLADFDAVPMVRLLVEKKMMPKAPILVVSGKPQADISKAAEEIGAAGWLTKPVDPERLIAKIRELLH